MKYILFTIVALMFTNCSHEHQESCNDNEESVSLKLTGYSSDFEVFAEADPFVLGHESNVLSHFSKLPSFTALDLGSMSIRLIVEGKECGQKLNQPSRKGIYSFNIIPNMVGKGKLVFDISTNTGDYQVVVQDITVFADEKQANEYAKGIMVSSTNTTFFSKEQSWKVEFATDYPEVIKFGQVINTVAKIESAQGDEVLISSKISGIIVPSAIDIVEGRSVYKGETLFNISGSGMADNNSAVRFVEAQNNYHKTKLNYERSKELAKDKIVSNKELLDAKNYYLDAKALFDNLSYNFTSEGESVSSPIDGFVKYIYVQNGQHVESGQPVISISQNKTLLLSADVQQKYTPVLATIRTANIVSLSNNKVYTLEELNGKVLSHGRSTDNDNYLVPISIQIDNLGDFISGEFVEVYLKCQSNIPVLTIPNDALLEEQGIYYVYVQVNPELFEKREVKLGSTDGLRTEILTGITAMDRIVTKGVILIKLAQATGSLDAHSGHVH
ncbi:MAG: efflux RND transporter periplasmic adaptor subunit [Bacteroidota bacterium]